MNLELTNQQKTALHAAILTRVRHIEKMIYDWETYPDEHTDFLIKTYSEESKTLSELEEIIFLN